MSLVVVVVVVDVVSDSSRAAIKGEATTTVARSAMKERESESFMMLICFRVVRGMSLERLAAA